MLKKIFEAENIEYFAFIPYSECRVSSPGIVAKCEFVPKCAIVYLLPYYTGETVNISRYCASLDYHVAIREIGGRIINALKQRFPTASFASFGDHSPIDERHAALIAGIGILGDNGLIINEKYGSYVFIADILTDLPPDAFGEFRICDAKKCEGCGACKAACPTAILRAEGKDCLSAVTQRKGELSESEKALMRKYNTAWGCDVCQSVCPHNSRPVLTPIEFFYRDRIVALTPELISNMNREEFSARAFSWRGRATVERNLSVLFSERDES